MKKIRIYEPAMCCSTGVCGVSVDPELLRMSSLVEKLDKKGIDIKRFNLSSAPQEFIENKKVNEILNQKGEDVLPLTIVDDEIIKSGAYPSNEEFEEILSIKIDEKNEEDESSGCCSSDSGCCC
ncbi:MULTISPECIES: arsenite efflux transporter metallochaperone ArsD [Anaerococcus]|uniref:arsenite efflux transporter metallochaperone ArsD n=1 Tax=Anaerococcus TaxID=165779 RepID=UPI00242E93E6|nr:MULTISPECIES: arsenite efflux transporter metallochaperone ArsD [Anaerococcus]MDD7767018.1 arsenite efflux transporter metallochaperone ArsD [Anaerococcus vaginalis]MDY6126850.1 arsenite efflux transporter metallochaperone ArsD [Anaerococcus sp.]